MMRTDLLRTTGLLLSALLAIAWLGLMMVVVGFGKGMAGATPSTSDFFDALLWPGLPGFAFFVVLGYLAWRHAIAAALSCVIATMAMAWAAWFLM